MYEHCLSLFLHGKVEELQVSLDTLKQHESEKRAALNPSEQAKKGKFDYNMSFEGG
jgi:DnaJ-domain-containing protein 1